MFKYILDGNLLNLLNKQNKNLDQDFFIKNNIGGLFNIFDQNSDKIVTNNEISSIFNQFKEMAGDNSVLEESEILAFIEKHNNSEIQTQDFFNNLKIFIDTVLPTKEINNLKQADETSLNKEATKIPTYQQEVIDFLKDICVDMQKTLNARKAEGGAVSKVVDIWQKEFNYDISEEGIENAIARMNKDIEHLENEAKKGNFETAFAEMYKKDFDLEKFKKCKEEADKYLKIKTGYDMLNRTKTLMRQATNNDINSNLSPEKSADYIIQAFQLCGISSFDEMQAQLNDIVAKYKDHPDFKRYNADKGVQLAFKNGKLTINRLAANGDICPPEVLKIIVEELCARLDKSFLDGIGVSYDENDKTSSLDKLVDKTMDKQKKVYDKSFKKTFGKKNGKFMAETYAQTQATAVKYIEAGIDILSMAMCFIPAVGEGAGWLLTLSKSKKVISYGERIRSAVAGTRMLQQMGAKLMLANILNPLELLEQMTSQNGMSDEEFKNWLNGSLEKGLYVGLGLGALKVAQSAGGMLKTRMLVNALKNSGKSYDEIKTLIAQNSSKLPDEIIQGFKKADDMAKALQVSTEVALDLSSTYMATKVLHGENLKLRDWILSAAFALQGGYVQKQFAVMNTNQKVSFLQNALKDIGITKEDAMLLAKTMDDISAGKTKLVNRTSEELERGELTEVQELDEVTVVARRKNEKVLEGGIKDSELTEVAYEARHLAKPEDIIATPIHNIEMAEKISRELNLTDLDKVIIQNLKDGESHKIDGADNTEIIISKNNDNYDIEIRSREINNNKYANNARNKTNPNEVTIGEMNKYQDYEINPDRLPVLDLGNGEYIDLNTSQYAKMVFNLKNGEHLIIGRKGDIQTNAENLKVSREHVFIFKENGKLKIRDISRNKTCVVGDANNMHVAKCATGQMNQYQSYQINLSNLPTIELPGGIKLNLSEYKDQISNLREGQMLTIGRNGDILIKNNNYISRQHIIIYNSNGFLKIKNLSPNATKILENGYLSKIKDKINDIMGIFKSNPAQNKFKLTSNETKILNAFRNHPEIRALGAEPNQLKQILHNINKIIENSNYVSNEVRDAILTGKANLNNNNSPIKCEIEPNMMNDIIRLAKGEDYIMKFSSSTSPNEIMQKLPVGEVANVGGKLYVNNGSNLEVINLSEATFRKLFPPVKRFSTHQGSVGTCYLVSVLENMYSSPKGRVELYRRIGEDPKGIYTITANSGYMKTYFSRFDSKHKHIREEGGLAILEQGWSKNSSKAAGHQNSSETQIMQLNAGGFAQWSINGLIGKNPTVTHDPESIRKYIVQYANDRNIIINVGSQSKGFKNDTKLINTDYNIYALHEYSVKGYDASTDCVILCNPHHSGCVVKMPMFEFLNCFKELSIINL